ncbi:MAG: nucleoside monophosphate kinase [Candidatus Paceibacterota bacterium]
MNHVQTFVFFGIAGAGKGTQVQLLQTYLKEKDDKDIVYTGTGVGFRALTTGDTYTAKRIKDTLNTGKLMPDFFATSIVANTLSQELNEEKHLITDGYPRTIRQVDEFLDMMNFFNRAPVHVIYIEITKEESVRRNLLRGRSDDTKEVLEKRYDEYVANVLPAIEYIRQKPEFTFHIINGERSVEIVHKEIINKLNI